MLFGRQAAPMVNRAAFDAFWTRIYQLPPISQIAVMKRVVKAFPEVASEREFVDWAQSITPYIIPLKGG